MNDDYAPDIIITGPIVACQNAIDHYKKVLDGNANQIANAERDLQRLKGFRTVQLQMLDQWTDAKVALERAAAQ